MKEIIIIGTLHSRLTPHQEIEEILSTLSPDNILIELSPEELENRRESSIRDEMFFVYDWAIRNNVPVDVFDIENDVLREGCNGKELELRGYNDRLKNILSAYSWKDLNKTSPWEMGEVKEIEGLINKKYIDPEKMAKRDMVLVKNILEKTVEGRNVVFTGVSHLTFLKAHIPLAKLLFRD